MPPGHLSPAVWFLVTMKLVVTTLCFCVAALLAVGMVMLYSSSMTQVGARYLLMQLIWCVLGLGLCVTAAAMDYHLLRKMAWPLFALAIVLLVCVFVPHLGKKTLGARRWITFGRFGFQPSELAKLALIISLAWYCEHFQRKMHTFKRGVLTPALFIGFLLAFIFVEPDRGTTILMGSICAAMLLIAGVRWKFIVPPVLVALAGLAFSLWHDPMRMARIVSWLNPDKHKGTAGYQTYQALLALGSGGWTGIGLGNSREKLGFLPFQQSDFILPIIGEELGLMATLLIVLAFTVIFACGIYVALRARDTFGMMLASGLTMLIGFQAAINIGVVTGSLPAKGIPLPFISYGGSNLVAMLTSVGLLLSVARQARVTQDLADTPIRAGDVQPA